MILAGDVGATKILLEVGEFRSERWQSRLARRYSTAEIDNFSSLLTAFLGEWNHVRGKGERISGAGLRESHVHDVTITRESPNYPSRV